MFSNFTEETQKILNQAKQEMKALRHPYVGSEHLLLSILKEENPISEKLKEYGLTYDSFREELIEIVGIGKEESAWFLFTPLLKRVIENAILDSKENNKGEVTVEHLFSALLEEGEGVAIRILLSMNIDVDELYGEFSYHLIDSNRYRNKRKLLIDELGIDLTKKAMNGELDPVIGREEEVKRVLEILSRRTKNNPILIGEAGVGKTAIVEELARMISNGEVPMPLRNKRIISLDMATTVAGTKYRGEFEERMQKLLKEIEENEDIILFIDEIHTLVGAGGAEGAIDASNIFKPALSRGKLRLIGATTTEEYKKFIESDRALERRFQKVVIEPPTKQVLKKILMKLKSIYEKYHGVELPEELIDLIMELSGKYIYDRNEPDRSIDLLDEVCASVSLEETKELKEYRKLNRLLKEKMKEKNKALINQDFEQARKEKEKENEILNHMNELELSFYKKEKKKVTKEDLAHLIHFKTGIPVYEILGENQEMIHSMKEFLKENIIGQEKVISSLIKTAQKIKLGLSEKRCFSYLFCGPSGVGKTELAILFGEQLVGKENVIRLDMSEYREPHTISKIVGAPPGYVGYSDHHHVLEEVRNKPYSVIILDEIEKAHKDVLNLFLQVLETGFMKDSSGRKISFEHSIILMTSNIGYFENHMGYQKKQEKQIEHSLKDYFSIPFLNRLDSIFYFQKLTEKEIRKILELKINDFKKQYEKKGIQIRISKNAISELISFSEYEVFGARKLDKLIKEYYENVVIEAILKNQKHVLISSIQTEVSS